MLEEDGHLFFVVTNHSTLAIRYDVLHILLRTRAGFDC